MKIARECHECLQRLARQVAELSTDDDGLRARAVETGLKVVEDNFSYDEISITIATEIHRAARELTGNPDPYRGMKDEEMRMSRKLIEEIGPAAVGDFAGCLALSVLGNAIDFFMAVDGRTFNQAMEILAAAPSTDENRSELPS